MDIGDFNTVIVLSTINSIYGTLEPFERFKHTVASINSVRASIPQSKILFIDNSNAPIRPDWRREIEDMVDVFHQVEHNLFSLHSNMNVARKSESEVNMLYKACLLLKEHNLIGKRIFKISGRYALKPSFDYSLYEQVPPDKYTFVVTQMASTEDNWISQKRTMWLEQAFISIPPTRLEDFRIMLLGVLSHMRRTGDCIEETMFYYVPHQHIAEIHKAHVEGIKADGKEKVDH